MGSCGPLGWPHAGLADTGPRLPAPGQGGGRRGRCRLGPPAVGQLTLLAGAQFLVQDSGSQLKAGLALGTLDGVWEHLCLSHGGLLALRGRAGRPPEDNPL